MIHRVKQVVRHEEQTTKDRPEWSGICLRMIWRIIWLGNMSVKCYNKVLAELDEDE